MIKTKMFTKDVEDSMSEEKEKENYNPNKEQD